MRRKIFAFILISLLFSACAAHPPTPTPLPTTEYSPRQETLSAGQTQNAAYDATAAMVKTEVASRPTNTPPATRTPTATPIQTLPSQDAMMMISNLISTNGGCEFPCWWGIVPGKTTWDATKELLLPIAQGDAFTVNTQDGTTYTLKFPVPDSIFSAGPLGASFYVEENIVQEILNPNGWANGDDKYSISAMLNTFGLPDDVRVGATYFVSSQEPFFSITLFYRSGILATYQGLYSYDNNDILICTQSIDPVSPYLWFWAPNRYETFSDMYNVHPSDSEYPFGLGHPFISIDKISALDINSFYTMVTENTDGCIRSPRDFWPGIP